MQLNTMSNAELVGIFNRLVDIYPGDNGDRAPIKTKRFTSVAEGVGRVERLADRIATKTNQTRIYVLRQVAPIVYTEEEVAPAPESVEATPEAKRPEVTIPTPAPEGESKVDCIVALMRRDGGATMADMMEATGWLPHTTRAAISTKVRRKMGLSVETSKVEVEGRKVTVYRIAA